MDFLGGTERMSLFLFGEDGVFLFFFEEEETLTLTSGLCYQWLPVVLLAIVAGEQGNGLVLSLRGCAANPQNPTQLIPPGWATF